jgi:hypothetical protein
VELKRGFKSEWLPFRRAKPAMPLPGFDAHRGCCALCPILQLLFPSSCLSLSFAQVQRKLRVSRDLWKQRSAEKQQEIRQLRITVRDLSSSRENWKARVKELEQQLQAAHEAPAAVGPGSWAFFGGLIDNQAMPQTRRTPITLSSD